jgi:hypothetical protein
MFEKLNGANIYSAKKLNMAVARCDSVMIIKGRDKR